MNVASVVSTGFLLAHYHNFLSLLQVDIDVWGLKCSLIIIMSQNSPVPSLNSNLLNNSNSLSNPGLDKVLAKDNFVMDVYNMLNADKENVGYKMEKNLARTSKLR